MCALLVLELCRRYWLLNLPISFYDNETMRCEWFRKIVQFIICWCESVCFDRNWFDLLANEEQKKDKTSFECTFQCLDARCHCIIVKFYAFTLTQLKTNGCVSNALSNCNWFEIMRLLLSIWVASFHVGALKSNYITENMNEWRQDTWIADVTSIFFRLDSVIWGLNIDLIPHIPHIPSKWKWMMLTLHW